MTQKRTDLEINVTARADGARRELGELSDDVNAIEGEHEVVVDLDDNVTDPIADLRRRLDGLSDEDREIALRLTAQNLEREVERAERSLGRLDKYDNDEITLRIEARDDASRKLDAVQAEIRQIDGETVNIDVEAEGLDDLNSQLENLVGPALGAGALGGGAVRGGLLGALIAGAGYAAVDFADTAISAQLLADATGATVEEASKLLAVANDNKIDFNDIFDIVSQMNDALASSPELAEQLNLTEGNDLIGTFLEVVQNLNSEIDDSGERGRIAAQLFGEEGVRQVGMIQTTVGDLGEAMQRISDARIISDDDVDAAREIKSEMQEVSDLVAALRTGAGRVAGSILPDVARGVLDPNQANRSGSFDGPNPGSDFLGRLTGGLIGATGVEPYVPQGPDVDVFSLRPGGIAPSNVTIINPPGTPAATQDALRRYSDRNADR